MPLEIRASSMPRLATCGASQVAPAIRIDRFSPEASLGTAVHEVLASWIADGWHEDTITVVAAENGVEIGDVEYLANTGWRMWCDHLSQWFHRPDTSESRWEITSADGEYILSGHADLVSTGDPESIRILDWKTGRVDADHGEQMRAYALLALAQYPAIDKVYAAVAWIRDQEIDPRWYTRGELETWWATFTARLSQSREGFCPGKHCTYCPRGHECPGRLGLLASAANTAISVTSGGQLVGGSDVGQGTLSAHQLGKAWVAAQSLERLAEQTKDLVRTEVAIRGGVVQVGDGMELAITEQRRREVVARVALPLLVAELGEDVAMGAVSVSLPKIEDAVGKAAPRGTKGKAIKEFNTFLDNEGAISMTSAQRMVLRRAAKVIEEK